MIQATDSHKSRLTNPRFFHAWVLVGYTLLTFMMTWPLAINLTTAIPGDGFDGWQNYWNQWWIKVALVDRLRNPFVTDILYAPTGVGLYFHTLNPFNGLTTLPIQLSGGLILAYNAAVFISWILGGYGMFLLVRWLLRKETNVWRSRSGHASTSTFQSLIIAPFLAGLIFTFSPFHMAHLLGHMQVMSLQWIPFYILALMRSLDRRRNGLPWLPNALLAGLFLVFVGLCDWYFVLYLFFFTGLLIVWHWLGDSMRTLLRLRKSKTGDMDAKALGEMVLHPITVWFVPPLIAGVIFLLVLSPVLVPMVVEIRQFSFMVRPATDLYILSASVADFLIPNRLHTLFRPESFTWIGNQIAPVSERTIGIGYAALILAAIALVFNRKRCAFWIFCALFFFLLALGPAVNLGNFSSEQIPTDANSALAESATLFGVLNELFPLIRMSRSVSRYALMVQLCVAVLAGFGIYYLLMVSSNLRIRHQGSASSAVGRPSSAIPLVLGGLLSLTLLFEYWVAPFPMSPPDTPGYYEQLYSTPGEGSVLNLPMNFDRPGYLLYQTVHQKPLTVAYISRDDPRTLTERVPLLQHFRHLGPDIIDVDPAAVGPTILHDIRVDYVVLDRYKMPGGEERQYTEALAQSLFIDQSPLYEDDRITVYEVGEPVESLPYLMLGPIGWGPLVMGDGVAERQILDETTLNVHGPISDRTRVAIRYRTVGDVLLEVSATDPTVSTASTSITYDASPEGALIEVPIRHSPSIDEGEVVLAVIGSGEVWVEEVALVNDDGG